MKNLALTAILMAGIAVVRAQSPVTVTGSASATISVQPYLLVQFNTANPIVFNISDGGQAGTYTQSAGFTVLSNVPYSVITGVVPPHTPQGTTSPGSFTVATNLSGIQQPSGGQPGTITVTLAGLTFSNAVVNAYNTGGSAVIVVVEAG